MYNERDEELTEAAPSTPVKVAGLDIVPGPGDQFLVLADVDAAREAAEARRQKGRASELANMGGKRTLEDILNAAAEGEIRDLAVIVKADTQVHWKQSAMSLGSLSIQKFGSSYCIKGWVELTRATFIWRLRQKR